jgi:hypothetical protein
MSTVVMGGRSLHPATLEKGSCKYMNEKEKINFKFESRTKHFDYQTSNLTKIIENFEH